jgi:DNA-damage-inducible protein J
MTTTTMVHVRLDLDVKAQATEALSAMGLSVSDAVRVFLTRVAADKQIPFDLKVPNAQTKAAMQESRKLMKARQERFASAEALFDDIEKNGAKKNVSQ